MPSKLRKRLDTERKEKTRLVLLSAAERTFSRQGYHATLISDIVAEAGVGQGTFYRYFTSKRAVYLALFDRFVERLFGEFSGMTVTMPATAEEYRSGSIAALGRMATTLEAHQLTASLFLREGPSIDREVGDRLEGVFDRFAQLAKYYLDHAIECGFARRCDSRIVSEAIVGMGLRFLGRWLSGGPSDVPQPHLIEELVDLAFEGFGLVRHGGSRSGRARVTDADDRPAEDRPAEDRPAEHETVAAGDRVAESSG